jgi:hypothetical protein
VDPLRVLCLNASLQIAASCGLGFVMLLPMQPWARRVRLPVDNRSLLAVHLDLIMLAFMQFGAAFVLSRWALRAAGVVAGLLVFGGWVNPLPYLLRGAGINAFVLGGSAKQRVAASLAGLSAASILVAWSLLAAQLALRGGYP